MATTGGPRRIYTPDDAVRALLDAAHATRPQRPTLTYASSGPGDGEGVPAETGPDVLAPFDYIQATTPSDPQENETWLDTTTSPYALSIYRGGAWASIASVGGGSSMFDALTWVLNEGAVVSTGVKNWIVAPFNATITSWTILADQTGDLVIDVWKTDYSGFPATVADTITGSNPATLSASRKATDSTLTGWSTAISAGDILGINVNSASLVTVVTFALTVLRTS